jgi:RNA polymerase sigma-70 factor (ECF subfamily)
MDESPNESPAWDRLRDALQVIARLQVDPALHGKLDLSGVVQQTLLEAYQGRERWQGGPKGQQFAWLRRALANNLADELRKLAAGKRDLRREQALDAALEHSSARIEGWLAADHTSPSDKAERHEQELALAEALLELPPAQREALILQHWHGRSLAEIGEVLGKSPAAVAGLIKRGLAHLRERIRGSEV